MGITRCFGCMRELSTPGAVCPHCGYDNTNSPGTQAGHTLPCGTVLHGKYVIGKTLGQGGFGVTYIGFDLALETTVCVKEYFPDGAAMRDSSRNTAVYWSNSGSAQALRQGQESFLKEARKAAKLRDLRSVVTVWDVFQENATAYIVMDYIEGMTLKGYLIQNGKPLSESACVELLSPVMRDLEEVHKRGIVHRDISPDNLMLREDGTLILLDLGAAKDLSRGVGQSSFVVAKKGFSPIEQYSQNSEIGPWTDVYAMCATIVYCVTGKLLPEPLDRLMGKQIDLSAFSPAFADVLEKGLAVKPEDRIRSMGELLEKMCAAVGVTYTPEVKVHTKDTETNKTKYVGTAGTQAGTGTSHKSRHTPLILGIVAAILMAMGVLGQSQGWWEELIAKKAMVESPTPQVETIVSIETKETIPTEEPTAKPTPEPTSEPTAEPTPEPTPEPTAEPTPEPTPEPSTEPTPEPTLKATATPMPELTSVPTPEPTEIPATALTMVTTPPEVTAIHTPSLLQKPVIRSQPQSVTAPDGNTVSFNVDAKGDGLSYQWQYRKSNNDICWYAYSLDGNDTDKLIVVALAENNGYQYRCKISNSTGTVYSDAATLMVASEHKATQKPEPMQKLHIISHPQNVTAEESSTVSFSVEAIGDNLSYQWQYRLSSNDICWYACSLNGDDTDKLTVVALAENNGYQYRCKVSNSTGTVYSNPTTLTVNTKIVSISKASVGDTIVFGSYEQDNDTTNGKEKIEWRVLAREDNRILVISKYALDCQPYNTKREDTAWISCSLRKWLYGPFLDTAFTKNEKKRIPMVTVSADRNPTYDTSQGSNSLDQVFLLSIVEANKYFASDEDRMCEPTAYAMGRGCGTLSKISDNCLWLLRSSGASSYLASFVDRSGSVNQTGRGVSVDNTAVRPAMWITVDN